VRRSSICISKVEKSASILRMIVWAKNGRFFGSKTQPEPRERSEVSCDTQSIGAKRRVKGIGKTPNHKEEG